MNFQSDIAVLLAEYITKNKLDKIESLKYIEFTGERLFDNVREKIKKAFDCAVANQYGCYEANSIAYECPFGKMHCMESNIYVEIINKEGEAVNNQKGDIVITTLCNHTMSFNRYKIGDKGILRPDYICECGNKEKIVLI